MKRRDFFKKASVGSIAATVTPNVVASSVEKNRTRLIKINFETIKTSAIRVVLKETYGVPDAELFEIRAYKS